MAVAIRDRIKELRRVKASTLAPNPSNWRRHPTRQQEALKGVLREIGYADALLARETPDGLMLIDGHLRATLTPSMEVPVLVLDVTEDEANTILATLDPLASMAETEVEKLADLMGRVKTGEEAVQRMMAEMAEANGFGTGRNAAEDPGAQVDRAAELQVKWQTERGQLWEVGRHRLMCGDSTSAEDVARLMGGERWSLLVTDPPYGVSYAAKNEFLNAIARGNCIQTPIEADHQTPEQMSLFWKALFSTIRPHGKNGASYYVTGPQGGDLLLLLLALRDSGFPLRHMLIWAKNNHVLGRSDYNYKHEPIIYGWIDGAGHNFYGSASETSLWEIDKPVKSDMHPTMKPVELFARAIQNSSAEGDIVADVCLGSGTTMVAAEQNGRTCYGMEISPAYVAVSLERLSQMGLTPRLLEPARV